MVRFSLYQLFKCGDGAVELLQFHLARPEIETGGDIFRLQINHPLVLRGGAPILLLIQVNPPEKEAGVDIVRMRLECLFANGQGLFRIPLFRIERGDFLCEIRG